MWFFPFFFFLCVEVTNTFVLHVNGSSDVYGVRTTKVCDVTMMYCKERYTENVPYYSTVYFECITDFDAWQ